MAYFPLSVTNRNSDFHSFSHFTQRMIYLLKTLTLVYPTDKDNIQAKLKNGAPTIILSQEIDVNIKAKRITT